MERIDVRDAQDRLAELLQRVLEGERILITEGGRAAAILGPAEASGSVRQPGIDRGLISIGPEFDDPLPGFGTDR